MLLTGSITQLRSFESAWWSMTCGMNGWSGATDMLISKKHQTWMLAKFTRCAVSLPKSSWVCLSRAKWRRQMALLPPAVLFGTVGEALHLGASTINHCCVSNYLFCCGRVVGVCLKFKVQLSKTRKTKTYRTTERRKASKTYINSIYIYITPAAATRPR